MVLRQAEYDVSRQADGFNIIYGTGISASLSNNVTSNPVDSYPPGYFIHQMISFSGF